MKQKNNSMDERQKQITVKAMAMAGAFLCLCVSISMIYKVITTENLGWEFWALLGCALVTVISRRLMGDIEPPKSITDKPLPTGNSKRERRIRQKDYALQSVLFALVCAGMDVLLISFGKDDVTDYDLTTVLFPELGRTATIALTALIAFVSMFIISYIVEYLVGEKYKVKKYNQMLAMLEEE